MADTSASVSPFNFGNHPVRVVIQDGNPWFVAKDICDTLGYSNSRDTLAKHLDDDEKGVANSDTLGGSQNLTVINESGLYALVLRSRKPEARKFAKWVTSEVLPSIRKTGTYTQPTNLTPAQKQNLHELVDIVVSSGKQTHAETWARFHRKFHVNSYHELPADQFHAACQYLRGKVDGNDISALVKKHFPTAAPALPAPTGTERMLITKDLATGETTLETLKGTALVFRSTGHLMDAIFKRQLGLEVTQNIVSHATFGLNDAASEAFKQIQKPVVANALGAMKDMTAEELHELSTKAFLQLSLKNRERLEQPAAKGDRLMDAALAASAHA